MVDLKITGGILLAIATLVAGYWYGKHKCEKHKYAGHFRGGRQFPQGMGIGMNGMPGMPVASFEGRGGGAGA